MTTISPSLYLINFSFLLKFGNGFKVKVLSFSCYSGNFISALRAILNSSFSFSPVSSIVKMTGLLPFLNSRNYGESFENFLLIIEFLLLIETSSLSKP